MNAIEEKVYTLTDDALSYAADIYGALETIRYDPAGAMPDDIERMKEIRGLLKQALDRAKTVRANTGRG
ncbi:MAG: hypothetical protein IJ179_01185 [Oscillospiraceae bacterium]|nr:hypothetical protein [Oscillospiraceae bacterium]